MYNSLNKRMCNLHDRIMDLIKQTNSLEHKQIDIKRLNIISEVFMPLKKNYFQ
jgi:hypothetical protein